MSNINADLPTLGDFVQFLQARGCFVSTDVHEDASGKPFIVLTLKNTVGAWVIVSEPDMGERLTRSILNGYIRRLGLKRYIPIADPSDESPEQAPKSE